MFFKVQKIVHVNESAILRRLQNITFVSPTPAFILKLINVRSMDVRRVVVDSYWLCCLGFYLLFCDSFFVRVGSLAFVWKQKAVICKGLIFNYLHIYKSKRERFSFLVTLILYMHGNLKNKPWQWKQMQNYLFLDTF